MAGTTRPGPEYKVTAAPRSDEALIADCAAGSEEALAILMGRYKDRLMNFVFRMVGDTDRAADVVQETFIRMYRGAATYKPVAKFSTWLYTIASNQAKSELRRTAGLPRRTARNAEKGGNAGVDGEWPGYERPDPGPRPDDRAGAAIIGEAIQRALVQLPAKYREVVVLFDIQEMSYEEICRVTGARMGTVKSRLNRGRALLKVYLQPYLT